jgi:predicted transcriptional regulator
MSSEPTHSLIDLRRFAARIVVAYVHKNPLDGSQLAALIIETQSALARLGNKPERVPAVPVRQSVAHQYVICLECGWKAKILRRHLDIVHGLTPVAYRARWNLQETHPITATDYSKQRADVARRIGFGSRSRGRPAKATPQPSLAPKRGRGRPRRMPD